MPSCNNEKQVLSGQKVYYAGPCKTENKVIRRKVKDKDVEETAESDFEYDSEVSKDLILMEMNDFSLILALSATLSPTPSLYLSPYPFIYVSALPTITFPCHLFYHSFYVSCSRYLSQASSHDCPRYRPLHFCNNLVVIHVRTRFALSTKFI